MVNNVSPDQQVGHPVANRIVVSGQAENRNNSKLTRPPAGVGSTSTSSSGLLHPNGSSDPFSHGLPSGSFYLKKGLAEIPPDVQALFNQRMELLKKTLCGWVGRWRARKRREALGLPIPSRLRAPVRRAFPQATVSESHSLAVARLETDETAKRSAVAAGETNDRADITDIHTDARAAVAARAAAAPCAPTSGPGATGDDTSRLPPPPTQPDSDAKCAAAASMDGSDQGMDASSEGAGAAGASAGGTPCAAGTAESPPPPADGVDAAECNGSASAGTAECELSEPAAGADGGDGAGSGAGGAGAGSGASGGDVENDDDTATEESDADANATAGDGEGDAGGDDEAARRAAAAVRLQSAWRGYTARRRFALARGYLEVARAARRVARPNVTVSPQTCPPPPGWAGGGRRATGGATLGSVGATGAGPLRVRALGAAHRGGALHRTGGQRAPANAAGGEGDDMLGPVTIFTDGCVGVPRMRSPGRLDDGEAAGGPVSTQQLLLQQQQRVDFATSPARRAPPASGAVRGLRLADAGGGATGAARGRAAPKPQRPPPPQQAAAAAATSASARATLPPLDASRGRTTAGGGTAAGIATRTQPSRGAGPLRAPQGGHGGTKGAGPSSAPAVRARGRAPDGARPRPEPRPWDDSTYVNIDDGWLKSKPPADPGHRPPNAASESRADAASMRDACGRVPPKQTAQQTRASSAPRASRASDGAGPIGGAATEETQNQQAAGGADAEPVWGAAASVGNSAAAIRSLLADVYVARRQLQAAQMGQQGC